MAQILPVAAVALAPEIIEGVETGASKLASSGVGKKVIQEGENTMSKVLPSFKRAGQKGITFLERIGQSITGSAKKVPKPIEPLPNPVPKTIPKTIPKPVEPLPNPAPKPIEPVKPGVKPGAKPILNEGEPKESFKKKAAEALVLGGLVPGVGFTLAGNLVGQPSSQQNPDITNGDLAKAHHAAKGDVDALENYKFHNGKTFKQVRYDYVKANKDKLLDAQGDNSKLYTKTGKMTKLHKQARLHGVSLT
jgi:hypothetical protein